RVGLGIAQSEGRAPAASEHLPLVDLGDLDAQLLDVVDQVPGRVVVEARIRRRLAAAALVEHQDLVFVGVELPAMVGARSATGAAVQEYDRLAVGVAAQLPIEEVAVADVEHAGFVGVDRRVQRAALRAHRVHQKLNSSYMRETSPPHSCSYLCSSRSAGVMPVATTSRNGSRNPPSLSPALLRRARRVSPPPAISSTAPAKSRIDWPSGVNASSARR